jgi:hypothetical protein
MGGQRIDDHKAWMGSKPSGEVFPHGPHKVKSERHAEGFGALGHYEDTNDAIVSQQEMNKRKVHGHPHKPGTRN